MDAFDQRAGLVPARPSGRQRRIEMEMAVDERRCDEPAFRIELLRAVRDERLADARPPFAVCEEVDEAPVEQARVPNDKAHARESTARGTAPRARPSARTDRARPHGASRMP